jgi:hypothetical protein
VRVTPLAEFRAEEAGWYADPSGGLDRFRWWDGAGWTRWLSRDPTVGAPPAVAEPAVPRPTTPPQDPASAPVHQPDVGAVAVEPADVADQTVKLPAAVAITLATIVLALIAVGAVVALSADRPLTGPSVDPPAGPKTPVVVYDYVSRIAKVQELTFTAPGAPYSCTSYLEPQPPVFASLASCDVPVHPNGGQGVDWASVAGLGPLSPSMVAAGDLDATADRAFDGLLGQFYARDRPTITRREREPVTGIAPQGKAVQINARVNVRIKGLATHYDKILLVVFELKGGSYAAWFGLAPNDLPAATRAVLLTSLNTLKAQ